MSSTKEKKCLWEENFVDSNPSNQILDKILEKRDHLYVLQNFVKEKVEQLPTPKNGSFWFFQPKFYILFSLTPLFSIFLETLI